MPQFKKNSVGCPCCGCHGCPDPAITLAGFASGSGSDCANCSAFNGIYILDAFATISDPHAICSVDPLDDFTCFWLRNFSVSANCLLESAIQLRLYLQRNVDSTFNLGVQWTATGRSFNAPVRYSRLNIVASRCAEIDETFDIDDRCAPPDIEDVAPCDPTENENITVRVQFPE